MTRVACQSESPKSRNATTATITIALISNSARRNSAVLR